MGKKYSFIEIQKIYRSYNYVLLSKKYENYTTKLKCKCTKCGNITYKSLNMIQGPSPCKNCKQIKGIEKAKKIFKDKGCKLLENTYVDSCYCYELCMFLR